MAIGGLLLCDDLLRKIASLSKAKKVFCDDAGCKRLFITQ
jgi:hypothetical protein